MNQNMYAGKYSSVELISREERRRLLQKASSHNHYWFRLPRSERDPAFSKLGSPTIKIVADVRIEPVVQTPLHIVFGLFVENKVVFVGSYKECLRKYKNIIIELGAFIKTEKNYILWDILEQWGYPAKIVEYLKNRRYEISYIVFNGNMIPARIFCEAEYPYSDVYLQKNYISFSVGRGMMSGVCGCDSIYNVTARELIGSKGIFVFTTDSQQFPYIQKGNYTKIYPFRCFGKIDGGIKAKGEVRKSFLGRIEGDWAVPFECSEITFKNGDLQINKCFFEEESS